jgi:hypothetical protein
MLRALMPNPYKSPFFRCPACNALYQVVRAKVGPETVNLKTACCICSGPLVAREEQFVLKYFLLRKAARARAGQGSKRPPGHRRP